MHDATTTEPSALELHTTLRQLLAALGAAELSADLRATRECDQERDPTRRALLESLAQHARSSLHALGETALLHLGEPLSGTAHVDDRDRLQHSVAHGIELMRCLRELGDVMREGQLISFCEEWIEWRGQLYQRLLDS